MHHGGKIIQAWHQRKDLHSNRKQNYKPPVFKETSGVCIKRYFFAVSLPGLGADIAVAVPNMNPAGFVGFTAGQPVGFCCRSMVPKDQHIQDTNHVFPVADGSIIFPGIPGRAESSGFEHQYSRWLITEARRRLLKRLQLRCPSYVERNDDHMMIHYTGEFAKILSTFMPTT
jgi:hypothetical protein